MLDQREFCIFKVGFCSAPGKELIWEGEYVGYFLDLSKKDPETNGLAK